MVKPYRPSNGTEGMCFMDRFCDHCQRDAAFQAGTGDSCPIIASSMAYNLGEPSYPPEWVEDDNGPRCTAFDAADELYAARTDLRQGGML